MQYGQFLLLNDPGDKALLGPHGWFFYKQGVEYVTQHSAPPATSYDDPTAAICDFRDQLATRGIRLLVIPVPNKESVYPRQLSRRAASFPTAVCGRTQSLLEDLQEAGVEMVNLFELFGQQKALGANGTGQRLYLAQGQPLVARRFRAGRPGRGGSALETGLGTAGQDRLRNRPLSAAASG
jgi:hypothetical protein